MTDVALVVALVVDILVTVMLLRVQWKSWPQIADVGYATFCLVFLGASVDDRALASSVGVSLVGAAIMSSGYYAGFEATDDDRGKRATRRWYLRAMPQVRVALALQIAFLIAWASYPDGVITTALSLAFVSASAIVLAILAIEKLRKR